MKVTKRQLTQLIENEIKRQFNLYKLNESVDDIDDPIEQNFIEDLLNIGDDYSISDFGYGEIYVLDDNGNKLSEDLVSTLNHDYFDYSDSNSLIHFLPNIIKGEGCRLTWIYPIPSDDRAADKVYRKLEKLCDINNLINEDEMIEGEEYFTIDLLPSNIKKFKNFLMNK